MNEQLILLVEDNPDDEFLTLKALQENHVGNKIVVAHDGVEALDFLLGPTGTRLQVLPQLVLLDLKLPKVNGLQVLREIRSHEQTRLLPVVILTSSIEDRDVVESYRLGANSYVRKPVDFNEFLEAVKQLGLYWLVLNEPPR